MSVKIEICGLTASEVREEMARLLGTVTLPVTTGPELVVRVPVEAAPAAQGEEPAAAADAPKRERGKPAPGRARRTKEEITEDEAADAADASEAQANISTGEERIDPAQTDSEADAAQDAADEAEEVAANRDAEKPLTNDDLKAEMTRYVQTFGMAAVQEDGSRIFQAALGAPPAGEAAWKLSIVGDDQERLQKAVAAWREAIAINPFKREAVTK